MNRQDEQLESLIESHLEGREVSVPESLRAGFSQAVQAHAALQALIDETIVVPPPARERMPPNVDGHYEIERELGRGGMGVVYLAVQSSLNRRVALKVLRPGELASNRLVQRFLEEAQHLASLRHPHIVSIHDIGDADGEPYFTMDFIDGETLSALVARGPVTPARAVEILRQVAEAVQHAHRSGIIHRDLKPGNVLLDRAGHAFVTDFGLARNLSQESSLTQSGELLGTPQYMAPEQARGQSSLVGEATDIHALGLLLYELLTGKAAFGASSPAEVLVRLLNEEPVPPRLLDRRIPRDLETICLKTLQKSPSARYTSVSAVLEDLRRYEAGEPLLARRIGLLTRLTRRLLQHWRLAATVLVTSIVVAAVMPVLFDKSVEQLMDWGREELRDGNYDFSVQVLLRAWDRGTTEQREDLLPLLTEAIRHADDPQRAVDAALRLIEVDPNLSFRKHDFLVAQSLAMKARAAASGGFFEPGHGTESADELALRTLAAKRLSVFLEGAAGTADERREAEQTLQAIQRSLSAQMPVERFSIDDRVRLPDGTTEELERQAADESSSFWDRGRAAFAAGRIHESSGAPDRALVCFRQALEQLREVFPVVDGVMSNQQLHLQDGTVVTADAPECRLIRDVMSAVHRLDPNSPLTVTGGLRLRLDHPELLSGIHVSIGTQICGQFVQNPVSETTGNLSYHVLFDSDKPQELHILPGTYRLWYRGSSMSWQSTGVPNPALIDLSVESWPEFVTVTDEMVDLPSVNVRRMTEIRLQQPAAGARISLERQSLTWEPVEGADTYQVSLAVYSDLPTPTVSQFLSIRTKEPALVLSALTDSDRATLKDQWLAGRTVGFRVQAEDRHGKRLAVSLEDRRFLVVNALPE